MARGSGWAVVNRDRGRQAMLISEHASLEAYLRYGYSSRSAGRRMPGWAQPEPDLEPREPAREEVDM